MKAIVNFPGESSDDLSDLPDDESTYAQNNVATKEFVRIGRFETFVRLSSALIGAGIVNIPITFVPFGLFPGVLSLSVVCFLCYISSNTLILLESELHVNSLSDLALVTFGRVGEITSIILNNIFTFTCSAAYLMIGTDQIKEWLLFMGLHVESKWYWALIAGLYSLSLPVALTIPRRIKKKKIISGIITSMIIAYSLLVTGWSIEEIIVNHRLSPTATGIKFAEKAVESISIHVSTFALSMIMLPIVKHYNPSIEKRRELAGMAYILTLTLAILSGCFSYLITGEKTKPDFLSSFEEKSTMIIILQIIIFIVVTLTYPFLVKNLMSQWSVYFFGVSNFDTASIKQRCILIPIVNGINVLIAIFISDSSLMLGLGGALPGCLLCLAFPSLCSLKESTGKFWTLRNIGHILMVIIGVAFGVICTIFIILDLAKNANKHMK